MKKKERIYRELLGQREQGSAARLFTQAGLASACGVSAGMVHKALRPLEQMGAIQKTGRGFRLTDAKRALLHWASVRNLPKDIVYQTHASLPVEAIEQAMPPALFTAYSGFKFRFKTVPAEYSEVLVYADAQAVAQRFPERPGPPNVIVLEPDPLLRARKAVPLAQLFVDLWNLDTWYAKEFIAALEQRLGW